MNDTPNEQVPPPRPATKMWLLVTLGFVITLLAGLAIGLRLRPQSAIIEAAVTPATSNGGFSAAPSSESASSSETQSASNPNLMTVLLSDARHFDGDPNAPITFIELSDFK